MQWCNNSRYWSAVASILQAWNFCGVHWLCKDRSAGGPQLLHYSLFSPLKRRMKPPVPGGRRRVQKWSMTSLWPRVNNFVLSRWGQWLSKWLLSSNVTQCVVQLLLNRIWCQSDPRRTWWRSVANLFQLDWSFGLELPWRPRNSSKISKFKPRFCMGVGPLSLYSLSSISSKFEQYMLNSSCHFDMSLCFTRFLTVNLVLSYRIA